MVIRRASASLRTISSTAARSASKAISSSNRGAALGVLGPLAGLGQPQENAAADLEIAGAGPKSFEDGVGSVLEGSLHPAHVMVGGDGQAAALALTPELQQRVLQERQGPGLALHMLDEEVGQARLQGAAGECRGVLDGQAQLVLAHRPDQLLAVRQRSGQIGIRGALAEEIDPHGQEHQRRPGHDRRGV